MFGCWQCRLLKHVNQIQEYQFSRLTLNILKVNKITNIAEKEEDEEPLQEHWGID